MCGSYGIFDEFYEAELAKGRQIHRRDYIIVTWPLKGNVYRGIVPESMARILVVADVHANLCALRAVLEDALCNGAVDAVWVLGDVVGYGPEPNECITLLNEHPLICVAGNHDLGVIGYVRLERFNVDAARACLWTRRHLSACSSRFLAGLPLRRSAGSFLLVHGSPRDPTWEYVTSESHARLLAPWCEQDHCLVGHTHRPLAARLETRTLRPGVGTSARALQLRERYMINPGSVGQPRDGDPRAAYVILNPEAATASFHRVSYDVGSVAEAVERSGLPLSLARRLHVGY